MHADGMPKIVLSVMGMEHGVVISSLSMEVSVHILHDCQNQQAEAYPPRWHMPANAELVKVAVFAELR